MKRVLVTRPEPGATRTAARLERQGFQAIKLPLSHTVGLTPELSHASFDAVVATSAQAFSWLQTEWGRQLGNLPTWVVGAASAEAARKAGFENVFASGGDVAALVNHIQAAAGPNSRLAYLCGKVRRPDLEEALSLHGLKIEPIEVYDTKSVSYTTDKLKILLESPIDAVLLTSAKNAEDLQHILANPQLSQSFDNTQFICFSKRISDCLEPMLKHRIRICKRPDEDALMDMLASLYPA